MATRYEDATSTHESISEVKCLHPSTRSQAVLVALGINWEGRREVLGVELANRESLNSWKDFISALNKRGLREFERLGNGHFGSHQFLVDDFLKACTSGSLPPVNVWRAASFCAPGIVAHESAKREGEPLPILDLGSAPV